MTTAGANRKWPSPPNVLRLKADEVHIWQLALDLFGSAAEKFREVLAPEEAARADRFQFEVDRRHFIVARACLRKLLGNYLDIEPAEVRFSYNKYGKPSLVESSNVQELNFNLTHSGGLALYALTLKRRIGIDLEQIRPEFTGDEIARRYFSTTEVDKLQQLPPALRHQAFFNCWTRKEAFIKAIGIGLSLPLDRFEVTVDLEEPAVLRQTHWNHAEALRWSLTTLAVGRGYSAALAVEGHDWKMRIWHLDDCILV